MNDLEEIEKLEQPFNETTRNCWALGSNDWIAAQDYANKIMAANDSDLLKALPSICEAIYTISFTPTRVEIIAKIGQLGIKAESASGQLFRSLNALALNEVLTTISTLNKINPLWRNNIRAEDPLYLRAFSHKDEICLGAFHQLFSEVESKNRLFVCLLVIFTARGFLPASKEIRHAFEGFTKQFGSYVAPYQFYAEEYTNSYLGHFCSNC